MPSFVDSNSRPLDQRFGERPSVLDFIPQSQHGAVRAGSATADLTGWIQDGLNSLATAGGGVLYLPWGVYPVVDIDLPSNVTLVGDGPAKTILKRRANLPTGRGVVNIAGVNSGFEGLAIDGQVTTPQVALYSSLSDPSSSALTANSSVRIHPGAKDVALRRFRIYHSGGYAVHIDARTGNVYRVEIDEAHLHDNRSWLFGAVSGGEIYGSWTGGILAQGDGLTNNYAVRGLAVTGGKFRRGTGNQIWSHVYGFGTLHSDFKIQGNSFEDIGRDGIMVGAVVGGDVSGNNFRRIGYVCTDDTNPGVPRWINGQWAVGLDTAGLTRGVSYRGNTFVNCYGAAMDLDGFAEGLVSDNTVIVSVSGEPEYSEDSVGSWAGNYCYGVQTSNTNNLAAAAKGVRVTGNRFRNCGLGAIRFYAARGCTAFGNTIEHPATAAVAPIILGNIGSGDNQRAGGNTVTDNDVYYSPGSPVGVVQEDANGSDFTSADVNRVYGNRLHGTNTFEFYKHATSGSRTAQEFASSKAALTAESKNVLQREDGYWRGYWVENGVSKAVFSLLDRVSLPGSTFGGPLWNISGNAVGGVMTTGGRTTSAFDDAVVSGKLYADGFLAVAATTFAGAEANVLPDTVGLIRYNATSKVFEQSTSVSSGARVWSAFGGSSLSGLTAGRVPFTTGASSIADTANLAWDNTNRVLTVTGVTATASIVAATSFIQSAEGFYTPSSSSSAIGAPAGGVTALSLISVRNDGAAGLTLARTSATARQYGFGIDASGNFFLRDQTAAAVRLTMTTAGLVTFGSTVSIDQAGNVSASAVVSAAGVNVSGTSYNSLQVPSGGVYAGLGATLDQALYLKTFAGTPNNPGAGYGGWSHRSGSTYLYWNGSAWTTVDLTSIGAGVTSLAGTTNQVTVSAATGAVTLSLPQNIHTGASPTFASMIVNGGGTYAAGAIYSDSNWGMIFRAKQASPASAEFRWANAADADVMKLFSSGVLWAAGYEAVGSAGTGAPTTGGGVFYARDTGAAGGNGGGVVFGANQGFWAGIKGHLHDGNTNTTGNLAFYTRNAISDSSLSERMRITVNGNVLVGSSTDDSSGARVQVTGFVRATTGFATPATATDAIQATAGGVTARFLIGTRSFTLTADTAANAGLSSSGQGRIYFDSSSNKFRVSENGNAYVDLLASAGVSSITGTANQVIASASTGAVTLSLPQSIHTAATPQFGSVAVVSASTNVGFSVNDGTIAGVFFASGFGGIACGSTSTAGGGHPLIFLSNNTDRGRITAAGNWLVGTGTDDSSGARLQVSGFVRTTTGFATPSTATDAIQATAGGVTARFLIGTRSLSLTADTAANAGLSGSSQGRIYFDSSSNKFRVSENGGAYVDLLSASGVASITGTTNQVIASASTGAVTLSLPQSIHTGASPQFAGLGIGTAAAGIPINVLGHSSNEMARFVARTDASNNRCYVSIFTTNPDYWWELSNQDSTGGGLSNGLAFRERSVSGASVARVYFASGGNVLVGTTTDDSSGARVQVTGFVRATTGFATPAPATDAIQATAGGVTARFLIGTRSLTLTADTAANAGLSSSGQGRIYFDSSSNKFRVSENGNAYVDLLASAGVSSITGTANQVIASASTGAVTLSLPQNIHTGASPTFASMIVNGGGTYAAGAIYSDSNWGMIFRARQASPAAAEFRWATAGDAEIMKLFSTGVLSAAGHEAIGSAGTGAPTTGGGTVYVRDTGAAGGNGGGVVFGANQGFWAGIKGHLHDGNSNTTGNLAFYTRNAISDLSLSERMRITVNGNVLVGSSTDDSSGARVQVTGFVRATTGFATPATATDAIQATAGGVTARFLIGTRSLTLTADTAANAGLSSSGQGRIYFDSSSNKFRVSENGNAYVDMVGGSSGITGINSQTGPAIAITAGTGISVATTTNTVAISNAGVTSLAGTTNQVSVSASTGAVTLSLPQNIHTGATPTFASVTAGVFSATASGSSITFQNSGGNFQVDGNGNISAAGSANCNQGFRVASTTVIDSARNATNLASATAAGVFQSQASGTSIAFQTTNFNFQVNGNGVVSCAGGYNVGGVNVINTSRQFVGDGVNVGSNGISGGGYNVWGGYTGQTANVVGSFTIGGVPYTTLVFRGGVLVSYS